MCDEEVSPTRDFSLKRWVVKTQETNELTCGNKEMKPLTDRKQTQIENQTTKLPQDKKKKNVSGFLSNDKFDSQLSPLCAVQSIVDDMSVINIKKL